MSPNASVSRDDVRQYPKHAQRQILASEEERRRIRANASLPKEAWIGLDETVFPAMDDVLTVFNDLRTAGLTTDESVFNKASEWQMQDYSSEATVSMDPDTETGEAEVEFDLDGAPLPIIHADFSISWRDEGGDMQGQSIDTLSADASARAVGEAAENLVLNGWDATIDGDNAASNGYSMYGLTNHPQAHTGSLSDWTDDANAGQIKDDLKGIARDLKDDNFRPGNAGYNVYIGADLEDPLAKPEPDFDNSFVREVVREAVPEINGIEVSDYLDPDGVLMFRPTRDVVDLAVALDEQVVQWESPFHDRFKTLMGFTPRVKETLRGQCGVAYYTGGTSA